jgi:lipoprotein-anchoring transpeptidase ErfK/SrfK
MACLAVLAACSQELPEAANAAPATAQPALAAAAALQATPAAATQPATDLSRGAAPGFAVTSILALDAPIGPGDYAWNPEGVADAPLRIVVDLEWQRIYVYRGGTEIGRSSIIYGADDKPTPLGTFPILQKKRHHISNLYGAPMPYMMRLTMDGVAIHASEVEDGSATHGCIGIPDEFAALLFAEAKLGDRVLITNRWMSEAYWGRAPDGTKLRPDPAPTTLQAT